MASDALVWELTKRNNCFLVKRNGVQFSADPQNLLNLNSFKYSGLANSKALGIAAQKEGAVITQKSVNSANLLKPNKAVNSTKLEFARVHHRDTRRIAKSLKAQTRFYRADLEQAALARWTKVQRSSIKKTKKTGRKSSRKN